MEPSTSVLLVGAGPSLRLLFDAAVSSGDFDVVEAELGADAEERLRARSFDLVLLESASAERAVEQIKALRAVRRESKVIAVSGDPATEGLLEAMREHVFAYFRAPIDAGEVAAAIGRAVDAPDWQDGIEVVSARPEWITLRLRCHRATADRVMGFLEQVHLELAAEDREALGTAVREILLNAVEHGGGLDPRKRVEMSRIRARDLVLYHVVDPGGGFSFEGLSHAAVSNPPDDPAAHARRREELGMRPGGFGILLSRSLVDELLYNERGNEVVLLKRLAPVAPGREETAAAEAEATAP